jgi:hypothetical protein
VDQLVYALDEAVTEIGTDKVAIVFRLGTEDQDVMKNGVETYVVGKYVQERTVYSKALKILEQTKQTIGIQKCVQSDYAGIDFDITEFYCPASQDLQLQGSGT